MNFPTQKFKTIVADPPWQYSEKRAQGQNCKDHRGAEAVYQCMTLDDIKWLPVPEIADDPCHLYLWVTNTFMREGHEVAAHWGFDVRNILTWVKSKIGLGYHFRNTTEHILFATKGKLQTAKRNVPTHFLWPHPGKHSSKPEEMFGMVESQSLGPYCELFARRQRANWVCWGKDTKGSRGNEQNNTVSGQQE